MARRFWLMKSDPDTFGWGDLEKAPGQTTVWDGIRNYQARNTLRDDVRIGDGVLFYHSQADKSVVGTATIARAGFPDPTQFDRKHPGFDPKSKSDAPTWYAVEIKLERAFRTPVGLEALRSTPGLEGMLLLKRGMRLSVMPVTKEEWAIVTRLGGK
ncbi:MAG TPA: EVE domain-containing protein [Candidatus Polarisedimenticolaceae bacterium]